MVKSSRFPKTNIVSCVVRGTSAVVLGLYRLGELVHRAEPRTNIVISRYILVHQLGAWGARGLGLYRLGELVHKNFGNKKARRLAG